jgi:hypothetical protein
MKFVNGLTVKELKEAIKDWPEMTSSGELTEVWIQTEPFKSSQVTEVHKLDIKSAGYDCLLSSE